VYEHNGGEVDQKYISDSGDTSVRLKQTIHETKDSAHRLATLVSRMARNVHRGFHSIIPPEDGPIAWYDKRQKMMANMTSETGTDNPP
jgi:hypothetical protein